MKSEQNNCDCALCKNNLDFKVSEELFKELLSGKVTLFAGAGISTESKGVFKTTFYESTLNELAESVSSLSFPEVMSLYCDQPNGRMKLLGKIKERFDNIDSFPELTRSATRFHRELGTFFPIRNIITTNWDTYFEEYCKATSFISDPDLAFWEATHRRVLKIHGSISNYGSIVATNRDYEECKDRLSTGIIGSLLKTILATQTIVFIGYSFADSDFSAIYEFVRIQMNSFHKQAYVISPYESECKKFEAAGFIPIQTDGTYFISQIKAHAINQGLMLADDIYDSAFDLLGKIELEHESLFDIVKLTDFPEVIFSACYQDGMIHALERTIEMKGSGYYSNPIRIQKSIKAYLDIQKTKLRQGIYEDVAYIEGYINGLTYLLLTIDERASIDVPMYFLFGSKIDIFDKKEFIKLLKSDSISHKSAHKRAKKHINKIHDPDSIVYHHPPWL